MRNECLGRVTAILAAIALCVTAQARGDESAEAFGVTGGWFGARSALARRGVGLELMLQADQSTTLAGGLRHGSALRAPIAMALDVDTLRLAGWRGGHVRFLAQSLDGSHGSERLVGDTQGFDNADAEPYRQVSELWLEQTMWSGKLRLKIGKADANTDFAHVERSSEFLNSSAGFSPTIQGIPTYPNPAASVSAFASASRWLDLSAGVFDGATHEGCHGRTGNRGIGTLWGAPSALFLVGEAGLRFDVRGRPGRLGLGAWKHTGRFTAFDAAIHENTWGWYAVFDQLVFREAADAEQGLGVFAQAGAADAEVNEIHQHVSLGLAATGLFPGRDADRAGLMLSTVRFSRWCPAGRGAGRETAIELFYGARITPWFSIKPDLQLVIDPGGIQAPRALVGTLRLIVSL